MVTMALLRSQDITREIDALEGELSEVRTRVESDSSAFAALEQQVAELRERLMEQREEVAARENRLAEKRAQLAEAERLEALQRYEEKVGALSEAAGGVRRAAGELLAAINSYDDETLRLRRFLGEMRDAFGNDARVADVEAVLENEPHDLRAAWADVIASVGWRLSHEPLDSEADLIADLEPEAGDKPRTRIMEYFSKS
jgi:chromosome segregation ATPase